MNSVVKPTLIRVTTAPISLKTLLRGQLRFMADYFHVIGVSSPGPDLDDVVRHEGVPCIPIPMTRKITPFQDLLSLIKMWWVFIKERPFIVHSHTPKAGIIAMMAAFFAGVPIRLHTVAGLPLMEESGIKKQVLIWVEKLTYFFATNVYPNSRHLMQYLVENQFGSEADFRVIANGSSNGIDTDYFSRRAVSDAELDVLKESFGIQPDDPVFLFIGRVVKDKGIHELISAFTRLHAHHPYAHLILVGPYEPDLDHLSPDTLRAIELHSHIHHVGYQADVRPFLALASIFVFPSYREGFPNAVLQAGCFDLPCIVTDINGCNEIIIPNQNGILVEPKNAEELYTAMMQLIENPSLRQALGATSRQRIIDTFSQPLVHRALLAEYQHLMENRTRS